VVGTKADRTTVESGARNFRIGPLEKVILDSPFEGDTVPPNGQPTFVFDTNCNVKFSLEFSPVADFSDPKRLKKFTLTVKDPSVSTSLSRTLTKSEWKIVSNLLGTKGYFRIKAWDGINRETVSEVRSINIK
jgi:hypothetical protein